MRNILKPSAARRTSMSADGSLEVHVLKETRIVSERPPTQTQIDLGESHHTYDLKAYRARHDSQGDTDKEGSPSISSS